MKSERERRSARRAAAAAALESDPQTSSTPAPPVDAKAARPAWLGRVIGGKSGKRLRNRLTTVGVLLAVAAPIALWAYYQFTYVVCRNAQVQGYITQVGAQVDGVVASVDVQVGQRVKAGDVLARFADFQLQANLQRAQSQLNKAKQALEGERLAIIQEKRRLGGVVDQAAAQADAARANALAARTRAEDAKAQFAQSQELSQRGLIAPESRRLAETAQRTADAVAAAARADQSAAEAAHRLATVESEGIEVRTHNLKVLEADVAAYTADESIAEAGLKAAVLRAPGDGWVVRRGAEAGTSVVVGQPVVALWIGKDLWVDAWVDEDDLADVAGGNKVRVTIKAFARTPYKGRVESVGVTTDYELPDASVPQPRDSRIRVSPVVCVRVRLDHVDGLFPGLSAVVGIEKKRH